MVNKKNFKLFVTLFAGFALLFSSCNKNTNSNINSDSGSDTDSQTPSEEHVHLFGHYDAVAPTCSKNGSKEYWECSSCGYYTLEKPSALFIINKGSVYREFPSNDPRYLAPVPHDLHWVDERPATYENNGMKAHYECSMCHDYFNEQYEHVSADDLIIPKENPEIVSIMDDIWSDDKSTKSGWDSARIGFTNFQHTIGTSKITSNNQAGWQMTKEKYTDFTAKLKIEGASHNDPSNCYVTKAFFIGADASNASTRYPGVTGAMPTGFAITVYQNQGSGDSWIKVFKWVASDCDYQKGTFLGGYKGDFESKYFNICVTGQSLTIFDENNNPLMLTPAEKTTYQVSSIYLRGYEGGSIGVYNWTISGQTYSDPTTSSFYIENFKGQIMANKDSGYTFVQQMLDESLSYSSTNNDIKTLTNAWVQGDDKYTIDASNGYDSSSQKGSWRLTKDSYNNFRFTCKITNPTSINPYGATNPSCTSFLFGAEPKGEFFKGYSLTIYYKDNGGSLDHWLQVHYHDGSAVGTFIGGFGLNLKDTQFYFTVINKYLHAYKMTGEELYGSAYWPGSAKGLYLENYVSGNIGVLKWDNQATKYSIYDVKKLDSVVNDNYSEQNSFKRVNVFFLSGQSNMEGNTKAIVNSNYYLRNYCNASTHSYTDYVNGYEKVPIAVHNNYMPNEKYYFTNPEEPMKAKFLPTKIGMGLTTQTAGYTYFGPEVGLAEKLNATLGENDSPIFLVKHASGGTSFQDNVAIGWASPSSKEGGGHLYHSSIQYLRNCLAEIKSQGYIPILKGVLWMQGESDASNTTEANGYKPYLQKYISDLRAEFATYAVDNDGMKINFIDAGIFEGTSDQTSALGAPTVANQAKKDIAALATTNYYLDTNSTGINCIVNQGGTSGYGGGDSYHYSADSMIKLGNGFADIIINNNMLLF